MRESLWDKARGIGIILVVYGHVLRGGLAAGTVSAYDPIMWSDYAIYTFHMPLFFLLAGLNVERSLAKGNFLKSKIPSIIYPYFLWSLLQITVQLMLNSMVNHQFVLSDLLNIVWRPVSQFWFLYAIFLCHVFAWSVGGDRLRLGLFSMVAYPVGIYFSNKLGILSSAFTFFLFYVSGIFFGQQLKGVSIRLAGYREILVTCLGLAIAIFVASRMGGYNSPISLFAAILGIGLVLGIAQLLPDSAFTRFIGMLGAASMPIYLMHVFATAGVRVLLVKLHVTSVALHIVAGLVAGLLLPLVAYYCAYFAHKEHWFGFARGDQTFQRGVVKQVSTNSYSS